MPPPTFHVCTSMRNDQNGSNFILDTYSGDDKSIPVKKNFCLFDRFGEVNYLILLRLI